MLKIWLITQRFQIQLLASQPNQFKGLGEIPSPFFCSRVAFGCRSCATWETTSRRPFLEIVQSIQGLGRNPEPFFVARAIFGRRSYATWKTTSRRLKRKEGQADNPSASSAVRPIGTVFLGCISAARSGRKVYPPVQDRAVAVSGRLQGRPSGYRKVSKRSRGSTRRWYLPD